MKRGHLAWMWGMAATLTAGVVVAWLGRWIDFGAPVWLSAGLLLPLIVVIARHGIAGLPPRTAVVAVVMRLVLLSLTILALADVQLVLRNDELTVIFLVDQSASIADRNIDAQLTYINEASRTKRRTDRTGVVVFGGTASVELGPTRNVQLTGINSAIDRQHTDIEQAVRLAANAFPPNTRKKLVLMTDGNENDGSLREGLRQALGRGIGIDLLPIRYAAEDEVLIEKVYIPDKVTSGEAFPLRVHLRSVRATRGVLSIYRDGVPIAEQQVDLKAGPSTFAVPVMQIAEPGFYTYTARISPEADRIPQNNEASGYVYVRGKSRILLVSPTSIEAEHLAAAAREQNLETEIVLPDAFPANLGQLQDYDCVVLCNVEASQFPQGHDQMRLLRAAVRDQGIGLIMIGGSNSFGAGDYGGSPIEDALPVTMDISQKKVIPKGALVLILHTCEFANGNYWAKQISKEAIRTINPQDEAGLIYYDNQTQESWLFELSPVENKPPLFAKIDNCDPGDMPSFVPPFNMAYEALSTSTAMVRHIVLISDGDPQRPSAEQLGNLVAANVTVSTIGINPHTEHDTRVLSDIAEFTGGRYYFARDPSHLPAIFVKEAKVVKRSLIFNEIFQPTLVVDSELTQGIQPEELPPLKAYVATTPKPRALVPIVSDNENHDPILAYWNYGLGKTVAFTSDATRNWAEYWVDWNKFNKFWGQVIRWSSRQREEADLEISVQMSGSRGKVIVDAVDDAGNFINFLQMNGRLTDPSFEGRPLDIRQVSPGRYEGEFVADAVGVNMLSIGYVNPQSGERGFLASGISVPYSPEYAELETNLPLLQEAATMTAGQLLRGDATLDRVFDSPLPPVHALRSIWQWLIAFGVALFFLDVFLRRVVLTRHDLALAWARVSGFLRRPAKNERDATMKSLLDVKKQVAAQQQERTPAPPTAFKQELDQAAASLTPKPAARPEDLARPASPQPPADPAALAATTDAERGGDYTGRLLAAKRRLRERQDEPPDKPTS